MRFLITFSAVASIVSVVYAQTGPQAAKIPPCVLPCDTKAIATTTCTSVDQLCHCQQQGLILSSIAPCVLSGSNCTTPVQDLFTFESLFASVCAKFNISVPTNTTSFPSPSNSSVVSSGTPLPSSVVTSGGSRVLGRPWFDLF
ncbi:hypothetical protein L207DRAFT_512621 [Hyaloscypha variabilis F]|uniref:CFEM domain-containing protein n=1 Tax=Hyaloscypha variabilis (strain UAMH 11265 / GT02V1 / F) TaxID=1149755 RepID=A0A2J6RM84_HYAVF|nr:hypothetical protein L207DRAFT_512621 [Hyaloscypha variabilis F]